MDMDYAHFEVTHIGDLKGHGNWVTKLAVPENNSQVLVSASRDQKLIIWETFTSGEEIGRAAKSLNGHSHTVSDVALSRCGNYAVSSSWDNTLRVWDLTTGTCLKSLVGHTKDVLAVAISQDGKEIISGGRDKSIKYWSFDGDLLRTQDVHKDWVTCVTASPDEKVNVVVSGSWDTSLQITVSEGNSVKVIPINPPKKGLVNCIAISPDGSLCASGTKEGYATLYDVSESKDLYTLTAFGAINSVCFSPKRYWLCAATTKNIVIWDLESKNVALEISYPNKEDIGKKALTPYATTLAWSPDGDILYTGWTDGVIRVYRITENAN